MHPNIIQDGAHHWAVIQHSCELSNNSDLLLSSTVESFRNAYGEDQVQDIVWEIAPDPSIASSFDMRAILGAVRKGMPDPQSEGGKPVQLTNYRSEVAEIVARSSLEEIFQIQFPASPQATKGNANQPVLGFDGWGLLRTNNVDYLVLIQVKATDDQKRPPPQADLLKQECVQAHSKVSELSRALVAMTLQIADNNIKSILLRMLEHLGMNREPPLVISPVIVRGKIAVHSDDLSSLRTSASANEFGPAVARGAAVGIGVDLNLFGRTVAQNAREVS